MHREQLVVREIMSLPRSSLYWPLFMWLFPLSFFAYQFILRLWPGLMMHSIMEQFSIDASHFGLLAAFYYYGYAGMQIPVAILLDRFGARNIIFIFSVLCGLATLLFTYTHYFYLAVFSRFLIGAGSAVGFLGVSKVVSEWFPKRHYARMIGFSFTFGLLGAIYGGKPISLLIEQYSWQHVEIVLAVISVLIGCAAWVALRSPRSAENSFTTTVTQFSVRNFKAVLSSPVIWSIAFANLLMVGSLEGFADVWGVPYLMTAYGLEKGNAAALVSCIFFGMLFGGPFLALCSKRFSDYSVIAACGIGMVIAFGILLFQHQNSCLCHGVLLAFLFFMIGLLCCYQVIIFAAGSGLVAPENLGVTVAFLNCMNMLGGSFFHTIIGRIMDFFWQGQTYTTTGVRIYDLSAYHSALSIIPIAALVGVAIILMVRK